MINQFSGSTVLQSRHREGTNAFVRLFLTVLLAPKINTSRCVNDISYEKSQLLRYILASSSTWITITRLGRYSGRFVSSRLAMPGFKLTESGQALVPRFPSSFFLFLGASFESVWCLGPGERFAVIESREFAEGYWAFLCTYTRCLRLHRLNHAFELGVLFFPLSGWYFFTLGPCGVCVPMTGLFLSFLSPSEGGFLVQW